MANKGWLPPTKTIDVFIQHVKSIHAGYGDEWCIWLRTSGKRWEARGKSRISADDARSKVERAYKREINFVGGFDA